MHDVDGMWENIAEIRMKKLFRSCRGRCKMSSFFSSRQRRAEKPVQQCKARDQNNYPYPEDNEYSDCAIESKKSLSFVFNCIVHPSCMDRPKIEKSGQKKRQLYIPVREKIPHMGIMVYHQTTSVVLTLQRGGHHACTRGTIDDQRDVPQMRIHI